VRFSLLLSDVDNTLFDFRSAERAAYAAVSARFSLPGGETTFALYQAINKEQWQKLDRGETTSAQLRLDRFADFAAALGIKNADVQAMSDFYVQALSEQRTPVSGAQAFLSRVSAQMPVCLITNGFAAVQRERIQASPLRLYISGMLISEEFAHPKPHPEMLLEAMKRMHVADPRQVVMIGDSEAYDIRAAVNAGVPSILFTNSGIQPKATQADFVAATLEDAAEWMLA
jgi:2-haloacid dehalogenase